MSASDGYLPMNDFHPNPHKEKTVTINLSAPMGSCASGAESEQARVGREVAALKAKRALLKPFEVAAAGLLAAVGLSQKAICEGIDGVMDAANEIAPDANSPGSLAIDVLAWQRACEVGTIEDAIGEAGAALRAAQARLEALRAEHDAHERETDRMAGVIRRLVAVLEPPADPMGA